MREDIIQKKDAEEELVAKEKENKEQKDVGEIKEQKLSVTEEIQEEQLQTEEIRVQEEPKEEKSEEVRVQEEPKEEKSEEVSVQEEPKEEKSEEAGALKELKTEEISTPQQESKTDQESDAQKESSSKKIQKIIKLLMRKRKKKKRRAVAKKKSKRKQQYDRMLVMVRMICVLGVIAFCCIPDKEKPVTADEIVEEAAAKDTTKELQLPAIKRAEKEINKNCEAYRSQVEQMAARYGIPHYSDLLMALMMQESGGKGLDIMQSSEGAFNTRYERVPNGITDVTYSIECGVQELKEALVKADVEGPYDIPRIEQALQAYNFGIRYLDYSEEKGVTEWNEQIAADYAKMASNGRTRDEHDTKTMGKWDYGDQFYPEHVLRYYEMPVTIKTSEEESEKVPEEVTQK